MGAAVQDGFSSSEKPADERLWNTPHRERSHEQAPSSSPRAGGFSITHGREKPSSQSREFPRITVPIVQNGFASPRSHALLPRPLSANVPARGSERAEGEELFPLPSLPSSSFPFFPFHYLRQGLTAGLELTMQLRLTSHSQKSSSLSLSRAEITGPACPFFAYCRLDCYPPPPLPPINQSS